MQALNPSSGSINGGYKVTIQGQGLPFHPESTFQVFMCGKRARVVTL